MRYFGEISCHLCFLSLAFVSVASTHDLAAASERIGAHHHEESTSPDMKEVPAKATSEWLFRGARGSSVESLFLGARSSSLDFLFGQGGRRPAGQFFEHLTKEQQRNVIDRAFPLDDAKWDCQQNSVCSIFVCWEDLDDQFADERAFVKKVVKETWGAVSALEFIHWGACVDPWNGVRISVQDRNPGTQALGKHLTGKKEGVILNFVYKIWDAKCGKNKQYWNICTRSIVAHEWGHVVGLSHEQNRSDTPRGECKVDPQGTYGDNEVLTPWDPLSIMNYCNRNMRLGVLSDFDKLAMRKIYGSPP